jgi:hypothetical protein
MNDATKIVCIKGANLNLTLLLDVNTTINQIKHKIQQVQNESLSNESLSNESLSNESLSNECESNECNLLQLKLNGITVDDNVTISQLKVGPKKMYLMASEKKITSPQSKKRKLSPSICVETKCNFYGSNEFNGMCSKCHSKLTSTTTSKIQLETEPVCQRGSTLTNSSQQGSTLPLDPTICSKCYKNVELLGFKCKCNGMFCGLHRNFFDHNCTFDYRTEGIKQLKVQNGKIDKNKINKI